MSTTDLFEAVDGAVEPVEAEEVVKREAWHYSDAKGKQNALQRLASESYTGTQELSWAELFNKPLNWLVQDLLPAGASAFLVAKPNTGKTFLYIDLGLNMVLGRPWMGKDTQRGRVMFVLGEGIAGFGTRLRAWCDRNGVDSAEIEPNVSFIDGANINHDQSLQRMQTAANLHKPDLIIFDTYAATSGIISEDDSAMTSSTLNRARSIYPLASMLFVSHPTKSTEDTECPVLRGSSALKGSIDTVISLFRDRSFQPLDSTTKREYLTVSTEHDHGGKNRNAITETLRGFYLDPEGDSMVVEREETGSSDNPLDVTNRFLTKGMTVAMFMSAASLSRQNQTRVTETYLRAHPDVVELPGGGRKPARYYWADDYSVVPVS